MIGIRGKVDIRKKVYKLIDMIGFYLGPDLIFLSFLVLVLVVLSIIYGNHSFTFMNRSLIVPSVVFGGLLIFGVSTRIHRLLSGGRGEIKEIMDFGLKMTRDWLPLLIILLIYENLHDMTDLIHPDTLDGELRRIDMAIFGVDPTLYLERFITPVLNDYMTISYAPFFLYPAIILGVVYKKGDIIKFRELALAFEICVIIGFLGYIIVPAVGPRYFMANEYSVSLNGYITEIGFKAWNSIESVKRDCFPSLHTAMSTISLVYFYRFRNFYRGGKIVFLVSIPLIVSLWISTVYLRYHWVVDVFAGWALALICVTIAPRFIKWYYYRKNGIIPEVSTDLAKNGRF